MSIKASWMVVWLVLGWSLAAFPFSGPRDPRDIAKRTFPSVVLLSMSDASGQVVSLGSGFFVLPDVVVTSLHVIEGMTQGYAKRVGDETYYPVAGTVAVDEQHDLVLVKIAGARSTPLQLGDPEVLTVGDRVFAVGSPRGYEGTFSEGIVSGIRPSGVTRLLQITSPIARGSSGGPVVNARGDVVGVATALVEGEQNINFALPISYLRPLLRRVQPVMALGSISPGIQYAGTGGSIASPSVVRASEAILTSEHPLVLSYQP
jgi:S1-C subfamily serine protease